MINLVEYGHISYSGGILLLVEEIPNKAGKKTIRTIEDETPQHLAPSIRTTARDKISTEKSPDCGRSNVVPKN